MKKLSTILLALLLAASAAACGAQPEGSSPSGSASGAASSKSASSEPETPASTALGSQPEEPVSSASESGPKQETGKILVVYYSASGNTESAVQAIAAESGADLFEIVPVEPYTEDDLNWRDDNSRVVREHNDPGAREIALESAVVPGWENYDTVFVGYPIWWGIAAWPVDGFVKANDFTGKTVIPFCTSTSSGIGESGDLLAELAGTGEWRSGQRFSGSVSEAEVQEWVAGLGL